MQVRVLFVGVARTLVLWLIPLDNPIKVSWMFSEEGVVLSLTEFPRFLWDDMPRRDDIPCLKSSERGDGGVPSRYLYTLNA